MYYSTTLFKKAALAFLVALLVLVCNWNTHAQTPAFSVSKGTDTLFNVTDPGKVGIGTTTPEFKLSLSNDGGILAKGTYGSGFSMTTAGAGTRLIWYPRKSAFRAGEVAGTQWDDANIGLRSAAFGLSTKANGLNSFAAGSGTTASGNGATALGRTTTATGDGSTALGFFTTAAAYGSTVLGRFNQEGIVYTPSPDTWVEDDPLFIIGNGSSSSAPNNALTMNKKGNVWLGHYPWFGGGPRLTVWTQDSLSSTIMGLGGGLDISMVGWYYKTAGHFAGLRYGVIGEAQKGAGTEFRSGGYFLVRNPDLSVGPYAYVGARDENGTNYKIVGTGLVSTVMDTRQGKKTLFAPESPQPWFEDFGDGQLSKGHCRITLEPLFFDCVTVSDDHPLKVFIQLNDDCNGVYVKTDNTGFDVHELKGGASDAKFTYRIVASWKGYENKRFSDAPLPAASEPRQVKR